MMRVERAVGKSKYHFSFFYISFFLFSSSQKKRCSKTKNTLPVDAPAKMKRSPLPPPKKKTEEKHEKLAGI
jgi:hypothetical protein